MNKKQRIRNRETARNLHRHVREVTAPICENCGLKGRHWLSAPWTLENMVLGTRPEGIWLCEGTAVKKNVENVSETR